MLLALLFALQIAAGAMLLVTGVFVLPVREHFQLDAVLSPEQLQDDEQREFTLALLKRVDASSNLPLLVSLVGIVVTGTAVAGIVACFVRVDNVFPSAPPH